MPEKRTTLTTPGKQAQVTHLPLDRLLLDPDNPRLASAAETKTQEELVRLLWEEMAVDEVALSIAANGYFKEEPLFVVPARQKGKYVVAEGNRRLAAVLLLRDEQLRKRIGATDLPKLGAQQRAALALLPVSTYEDKEQLWQYFGFRHINGPKSWDAFAKAKYVADVHEEYGIPLEKIAKTIGDRHSFVKRIYRGYRLLHQAESQAGFSRDDIMSSRFAFSHLYTAADQPDFQKFLGVAPDTYEKPNPVPKNKLEELGELMTWLYGSRSKEKPPIVRTQNPDLNLLRVAVSKPQALAALRAGYSLERAYQIGTGDKVRFRESLTRAKEELQQASATAVTGYAGEDDLLKIMEEIFAVAEKLKLDMEQIRLKSAKTGRTK